MSDRDLQSLLDMLVSARLATGYVTGKTWAEAIAVYCLQGRQEAIAVYCLQGG